MLLPEWLRIAQGYYLIIYAMLVMVLMMFCPTGIIGLGERLISHLRQKKISSERSAQAQVMGTDKPGQKEGAGQ